MLGEAVYERGLGGQDGTSMRRMMVMHEREGTWWLEWLASNC
jgi:hypothetical protein